MRELRGLTEDYFRLDDITFESKTIELENVRLLEKIYKALEQGDLDGFTEQLDDSVHIEISGPDGVPFVGKATGKANVIEFALNNFSQLSDQHAKIQELIAQGNTVVVFGTETGCFKENNCEYEMEWVHRFKFENGKVTSIRQVFDTASVLKAASGDD